MNKTNTRASLNFFIQIAFMFFCFFSSCTFSSEDEKHEIPGKDAREENMAVIENRITRQIIKEEEKIIETRYVKGNPSNLKSIDFSMHSGYFKVAGGSREIAEIIFVYEDTSWQPAMRIFDEEKLKMKMPNRKTDDFELNINDDVSIDNPLRSCAVRLGELELNELELKLGAGSANFDLANLELNELDIKLGVGEMEVYTGNSSPSYIELDAGIGDVYIDLTGKWNDDLEADLQGGIGSLKVLLPRAYNLDIKAGGLLGDIDAREFKKVGKRYSRKGDTNDDITLYIDIVGAIGEIELVLD